MRVEHLFDEDRKPFYRVTSDKFQTAFMVKKTNSGHATWEILRAEGGGVISKELSGAYTRAEIALKAIANHIEKAKPTLMTKRANKEDT